MATTLATWTIDPVHSSVEFSLDYMGFSTYRTGFRALEGSLQFDAAQPGASSVTASIPVASPTRPGPPAPCGLQARRPHQPPRRTSRRPAPAPSAPPAAGPAPPAAARGRRRPAARAGVRRAPARAEEPARTP